MVSHPGDGSSRSSDGSSSVELHGRAMVFLNPAHPGVRQRFLGLIGEIVDDALTRRGAPHVSRLTPPARAAVERTA